MDDGWRVFCECHEEVKAEQEKRRRNNKFCEVFCMCKIASLFADIRKQYRNRKGDVFGDSVLSR